MTDVTLKLIKPYKSFPEQKADKIVLPAQKGMFTFISGRAPISLFLNKGVIKLLDNNNRPFKYFFVKSGLADINNDICTLSAEIIDMIDDVSPQWALQLKNEAETQEEKDYYQMVYDELMLLS